MQPFDLSVLFLFIVVSSRLSYSTQYSSRVECLTPTCCVSGLTWSLEQDVLSPGTPLDSAGQPGGDVGTQGELRPGLQLPAPPSHRGEPMSIIFWMIELSQISVHHMKHSPYIYVMQGPCGISIANSL